MPSPTPTGPLIIGAYRFDPESGEIHPAREEDGGETVRLPPQPSRLLALLAAKDGALVTRDEIRAILWPDVQVDFDRSVNFCVHQLRSALSDRADAPEYIETLPRRGYRLVQPVERVDAEAGGGGETTAGGAAVVPGRRWTLPVAAGLLLTVAVVVGWRALTPAPAPRLAIMLFTPSAADGPGAVALAGRPERIAERLLADLGNLGPEVLEVVGPATTARFTGDASLRPMIEAVEPDWVLNSRFLGPGSAGESWSLLVELIRASDGAHVWVERVEDWGDAEAIARRAAAAVRDELGLEPVAGLEPEAAKRSSDSAKSQL